MSNFSYSTRDVEVEIDIDGLEITADKIEKEVDDAAEESLKDLLSVGKKAARKHLNTVRDPYTQPHLNKQFGYEVKSNDKAAAKAARDGRQKYVHGGNLLGRVYNTSDYAGYVDEGVNGTQNNRGSQFSYTDSMPPLDIMIEYVSSTSFDNWDIDTDLGPDTATFPIEPAGEDLPHNEVRRVKDEKTLVDFEEVSGERKTDEGELGEMAVGTEVIVKGIKSQDEYVGEIVRKEKAGDFGLVDLLFVEVEGGPKEGRYKIPFKGFNGPSRGFDADSEIAVEKVQRYSDLSDTRKREVINDELANRVPFEKTDHTNAKIFDFYKTKPELESFSTGEKNEVIDILDDAIIQNDNLQQELIQTTLEDLSIGKIGRQTVEQPKMGLQGFANPNTDTLNVKWDEFFPEFERRQIDNSRENARVGRKRTLIHEFFHSVHFGNGYGYEGRYPAKDEVDFQFNEKGDPTSRDRIENGTRNFERYMMRSQNDGFVEGPDSIKADVNKELGQYGEYKDYKEFDENELVETDVDTTDLKHGDRVVFERENRYGSIRQDTGIVLNTWRQKTDSTDRIKVSFIKDRSNTKGPDGGTTEIKTYDGANPSEIAKENSNETVKGIIERDVPLADNDDFEEHDTPLENTVAAVNRAFFKTGRMQNQGGTTEFGGTRWGPSYRDYAMRGTTETWTNTAEVMLDDDIFEVKVEDGDFFDMYAHHPSLFESFYNTFGASDEAKKKLVEARLKTGHYPDKDLEDIEKADSYIPDQFDAEVTARDDEALLGTVEDDLNAELRSEYAERVKEKIGTTDVTREGVEELVKAFHNDERTVRSIDQGDDLAGATFVHPEHGVLRSQGEVRRWDIPVGPDSGYLKIGDDYALSAVEFESQLARDLDFPDDRELLPIEEWVQVKKPDVIEPELANLDGVDFTDITTDTGTVQLTGEPSRDFLSPKLTIQSQDDLREELERIDKDATDGLYALLNECKGATNNYAGSLRGAIFAEAYGNTDATLRKEIDGGAVRDVEEVTDAQRVIAKKLIQSSQEIFREKYGESKPLWRGISNTAFESLIDDAVEDLDKDTAELNTLAATNYSTARAIGAKFADTQRTANVEIDGSPSDVMVWTDAINEGIVEGEITIAGGTRNIDLDKVYVGGSDTTLNEMLDDPTDKFLRNLRNRGLDGAADKIE